MNYMTMVNIIAIIIEIITTVTIIFDVLLLFSLGLDSISAEWLDSVVEVKVSVVLVGLLVKVEID